jgi:predicted nucleotide-binding protein (sugar kinase/HSP70/actin superfamily)
VQQSLDIEAELALFEREERVRLGLSDTAKTPWTESMVAPSFTAKQRAHTTLLLGGLTMAHDYLVEGALIGRGYVCRSLPCADQQSLRLGKEFGNLGQCNPTNFTVGNLLKELHRLRDEELLTSQEIVERYVFLTAGGCGPCRFGMYITEYRKALRDAGFEGFRVLLFQHTGGISQASGEELGLPLDPPFFFAIVRALFAGDVINALGYRIRPYEVEPGATDRALTQAKREVYAALSQRRSVLVALRRARKALAVVSVDLARPKAKVGILGEIWAMTTEGDGNYHMQQFIEREGGENDIQLLTYLILYNIWELRHDTEQRATLRDVDGGPLGLRGVDVGLRMAGTWAGELAARALFRTYAHVIGLMRFELPDMAELARRAAPHYNLEVRGGEGHLEVAKLIGNVEHAKTHMTLSLKPFGCMPSSSVSDGVQGAIMAKYPEAIFCALETSGDGELNGHSRVLMYLFKAKRRAEQEFKDALAQYGISSQQLQAFLTGPGKGYNRALYRAPHRACGTAVDLVHEVGPLIGRSALGRTRLQLERAAKRAAESAVHALRASAASVREVAPHVPAVARRLALDLTKRLREDSA